jgi:hypothetical protein
MQQAPGYQGQEPVRREYTPQQPPQGYEAQQAPGASAARAAPTPARTEPLSWGDWVRWGPIWAGFLTVISTLAILGALGAGISLTVWGAGGNNAFNYGWAILTGIVAYFLGGWVAGRTLGVAGRGAGMLNGGLVWALSLLAVLALAVIGASSAIGAVGINLGVAVGPTRGTAGMAAQGAWISFVTFVIGLILAMLGGLVGARSLPARGARGRAV